MKTHIVIHHSLTKDSGSVSWGAIRDYHLAKGWRKIGYHYGVEMVGDFYEILIGRFSNETGAHAREMGMNRIAIGICVVGNFDNEVPSHTLLTRVRNLVLWKMDEYEIPTQNVIGHREVGQMAGFDWRKGEYKSCPGSQFDMAAFRRSLLET
jgi:N-acetyl-anhydromuramyl-L-alanine amidase AmpD